MKKLVYADGENIGVYDGENLVTFTAPAIVNYKNNIEAIGRSKAWKTTGSGAVFRDSYSDPYDSAVNASVTGAWPAENGDIVYSFIAGESSGVYFHTPDDQKSPERHVVNSASAKFSGGCYDSSSGVLLTSVKTNYYNSDIAVIDIKKGDVRTVTEGDTADEDPVFSPDEANVVYYCSRSVGRDINGNFVCYSPSAIYRLDLFTMSLEEVAASQNFSYFRPVRHSGELYCIKAPAGKRRANPLLEIILIPYRILQGIVGFINVFVRAFSGKSLTSSGDNPAKGRDYDSRKVAVAGNLIDIEREEERNASKKDSDFGFVPKSWQLIKLSDGTPLADGVVDFDIANDGTIYYTNGRRIFSLKDGRRTKVCNTSCCLKISCPHASSLSDELFSI